MFPSGQGTKPKDDSHFLRTSKLRSSLRSKMTSLFNRRPQSCHLERFDINARSDMSVSSQSLFNPVGTGASPSLDTFLNNVLQKSDNPDRSPPITTLINSSGYVSFDPKKPDPPLRNGTRRRPVSIAECYSPQDIFGHSQQKPKESKRYLKKVVQQKEKISASISSLSSKIRLSRKDLSTVGQELSNCEYTYDRYDPFQRVRRNTITGTESPYRPRYQWNYTAPTFCSFPEKDENDGCSPTSGASLRHIDSSSEEDLRSTKGTLMKTPADLPHCPFSPFTRSRSEFLDISRVRAARSKFLESQTSPLRQANVIPESNPEPSISDVQNDLDDYMETEALPGQEPEKHFTEPIVDNVSISVSASRVNLSINEPCTENDGVLTSAISCSSKANSVISIQSLVDAKVSETQASSQSLVSEKISEIIRYIQQPIPETPKDAVNPEANDTRKATNEIHSNYTLNPDNEGSYCFHTRTKSLSDLSDLVQPLRKVTSFPVIFHGVPTIPEFPSEESQILTNVSQEVYPTKDCTKPVLENTFESTMIFRSKSNENSTESTLPEAKPSETTIKGKNTRKNKAKNNKKRNRKNQNRVPQEQIIAIQNDAKEETKSTRNRRRKRKRSRSRVAQKRRLSQSADRVAECSTYDNVANKNEDFPVVVGEIPKQFTQECPSDFQLVYLNTLISNDSHRCSENVNEIPDQSVIDTSDLTIAFSDIPILLEKLTVVFKEDLENSNEAIRWILTEGEQSLNKHQEPQNTLTGINAQLADFNDFYYYAKVCVARVEVGNNQIDKSTSLLEKPLSDDAPISSDDGQDLTRALTKHLESFTDKLNLTKDRLEDTAKCYLLLDKAYEWALQAMKVVSTLKSSGVASPEQVGVAAKTIGTHLEEHPPVPDDAFQAMIALATKLNNQTLLQQCKNAQSRCQETISLLKTRHGALLKARRQMEFDCQSFVDLQEVMGGPDDQVPFSWLSNCSLNSSGRRKSVTSLRSRDPLSRCSSFDTDDESWIEPQFSSTPNKVPLESRPSLGGIKELRESTEELDSPRSSSRRSVSSPVTARPLQGFSSGSSTCSSSDSSGSVRSRKVPHWKYPIPSQTNEDCPDSFSEESLSPLSSLTPKTMPPSAANSHLLIRGSQINLSNCEDLPEEEAKRNKRLLLITQELIQTERDYVRSLEFIIENYIPELLREDIPQALRGQRNVIFGNLEKIFEFHSGYFLQELESCQDRPFNIGSIFLKYEKQFYLYALYNKNKPKSDGLMAEYGTLFFRTKQMEIGDKMDLSSYLLKPVQRMGKYALLLKQLLKECTRGEEGLEDLTAAQEMVQFQLRHGNDLLAMDSLRDCDVNLKEQGRLLRQGELYVSEGNRKKSVRHVFLFEDMILFSKSRKDPEKKTLDIFQYKYSMKMTDIGLTEQIGDSPLKFEIWFRKRKPSDTYILQAPTLEMKETWTVEISKLLWRQALKNRSLRLHEMSSMGIGNKPCLDIRPNEDRICCRSVCIHSETKARLRPSTSSPSELSSVRRPNSIISVSSSASSAGSSSQSSTTGPSFAGTLNLGFEPGDSPRPLQRSVTRTSQCSAESGILADFNDKEVIERPKVERSNSTITTISIDSGLCSSVSPVTPVTVATVPSYTPVKSLTRIVRESTCEVKDRLNRSLLTTEV